MTRFALVCFFVVASYANVLHAHPEHRHEKERPVVYDETVKDPVTALARLAKHRDAMAQSLEAKDWQKAAQLSPELSFVAGDLVRVSTDLEKSKKAEVERLVGDLSKAGNRLAEAAVAKDEARVPDLLRRVNYFIDAIERQYPSGSLKK